MQSDPGSGTPHTGGNDDEVWRDLVARLEEADDAFMDEPMEGPSAPQFPKSVTDFDPLGVWHRQGDAVPHEPAAADRPAYDAGTSSAGPRDYASADEDERFVPAEPPSLSNAEPAVVLAWLGAAGGPLFLVLAAMFWRQAPMMLVIAVVVAFLVGTGYLLFRLPNHRDHDSGDGAVV